MHLHCIDVLYLLLDFEYMSVILLPSHPPCNHCQYKVWATGFLYMFNLVQELVLQDAMHWAVPTDAFQLRRLINKNN